LTGRRTKLQPTSWKSCILQAGKISWKGCKYLTKAAAVIPRTAGGCPKLDLREHYKLEINDKLEIPGRKSWNFSRNLYTVYILDKK